MATKKTSMPIIYLEGEKIDGARLTMTTFHRGGEAELELEVHEHFTLTFRATPYVEYTDDEIWIYGVLKPVEPLEEWQRAFNKRYGSISMLHRHSRVFSSVKAQMFKELWTDLADQRNTLENLRAELKDMEARVRDLGEENRVLKRANLALRDELSNYENN